MAEDKTSGIDEKSAARKALAALIGSWILLPAFFLATGRSLDWWGAWAWCAVVLVPMTIFGCWMVRKDPDFIIRRMKMRENQKTQRRSRCHRLSVLSGRDRSSGSRPSIRLVRHPLGRGDRRPGALACGVSPDSQGFQENRWAGRTIEIWEGQQVVSTGPYAVVRHPMYTGALVLWLATPMALGSWWALLPALVSIPLIALRIQNEEEVLNRELKSYEDYRRKVRYRLLPLVW